MIWFCKKNSAIAFIHYSALTLEFSGSASDPIVKEDNNMYGSKPSVFDNDGYVKNYVTTNRFFVEIGRMKVAAFSECSGVSVDIEKEVYLEGGVNDQQRISLGQTRFSDITLRKGMTNDETFAKWLSEIFEGKNKRRNVNVIAYNQAGETMKSWALIGAIPVGWKLPDLAADGNMVAVEELTLAFEGLKMRSRGFGGESVTRGDDGFFAMSDWESSFADKIL
jgi:phage tail-like protein